MSAPDVLREPVIEPSSVPPRTSARTSRGQLLRDGGMLAAIVLVSVLPYVFQLGFYSDDWAFLGALRNTPDQSLWGLFTGQLGFNENLLMRPTQAFQQALLYWFFGTAPLGYHLVNALAQATLAVLLYALLRRLGVARSIGFAVVAVFALLPHASTNRFWFASFGYTISLAMATGCVLADLRAARNRGRSRLGWKAAALALLLAAGMGYEVVLPLLAAAVPLVWWISQRAEPRPGESGSGMIGWRAVRATTFVAGNLVFLVGIGIFKATVGQGVGVSSDSLAGHIGQLVVDGGAINLGMHGLLLPWSAAWAVSELSPLMLLLAGIVALAAGVYLFKLVRWEDAWPPPRRWLGVAAAGAAVYALGYAIFVFTARVSVAATGVGNRTTAATSIGVALLLVAGAGLLATWLGVQLRRAAFVGVVAGLILCGFLINGALARYWTDAWSTQKQTIARVAEVAPTLPADAAVILDGVCPYSGPAVVFESSWDLAGALQVRYGIPDLRADVTRELDVLDDGLESRIYGFTNVYEYGPGLLAVDAARGRVTELTSHDDALEFFGGSDAAPPAHCERGAPGHGALRLPSEAASRNAASHVWALYAALRPGSS